MNFRDELSSFAHTSFHSLPPQQQLLLHRHSPTCTAEKHHWRSAIGFNQLNLFRKINKLQKFIVETCGSNQLKRYPCPPASMAHEISSRTFFTCTHVVWPSHASTPASVAKALPTCIAEKHRWRSALSVADTTGLRDGKHRFIRLSNRFQSIKLILKNQQVTEIQGWNLRFQSITNEIYAQKGT